MVVSIRSRVCGSGGLMSRGWASLRVCLTVAGLSMAAPVHAQIGSGALTGQVADQGGAPVPGAAVTTTAVATGASRTAFTTADGLYVVTGLAPGLYRVRVELA